MNYFPVLLLRNLHAPCASQARACVLCAKLLEYCCPRTWPARDPGTMQTLSSHFTLHSPHSTLHTCTSSQLISSELFLSYSMSSYMSAKFFLVIFMPSTSQYWCLLQKLVKTTSQYYFVLQSLRKTRSSTTLYYKVCTKHFPVLLCTTKLAQSTSRYYFVLQSLRQLLPSTTLYYKACTKHFPILLCTTKLAQNAS